MERRIMKGFTVEIYDLLKDSLDKQDRNTSVDIFQVMAEAMHKSKNNQINFGNNSNYSPATVAAASKFKRFLGRQFESGGGSDNNNIKCGSHTAPCSPSRQTQLTKLTPADSPSSKIELSVSIDCNSGCNGNTSDNIENIENNLSSSQLGKTMSGGWI